MSLPSLWIPDVSLQDIHSQGEVIACLEKALVREVEQQDRAHPIKEECQKAILRVAELSSDDFHLDRHLYFSCRDDRERFCQNVRRLYRCLHDVHASGDQTQTVNAFRKYGNYTWTGFSWFPTVETQAVWGWQIPSHLRAETLFYFSPQIQAGEGKVYKCLFNHKFEEAMSEKVQPSHLFILFLGVADRAARSWLMKLCRAFE